MGHFYQNLYSSQIKESVAKLARTSERLNTTWVEASLSNPSAQLVEVQSPSLYEMKSTTSPEHQDGGPQTAH